jgi:hypothetical protein
LPPPRFVFCLIASGDDTTADQISMFDAPEPRALPDGFRYQPDVVPPDVGRELIARVEELQHVLVTEYSAGAAIGVPAARPVADGMGAQHSRGRRASVLDHVPKSAGGGEAAPRRVIASGSRPRQNVTSPSFTNTSPSTHCELGRAAGKCVAVQRDALQRS